MNQKKKMRDYILGQFSNQYFNFVLVLEAYLHEINATNYLMLPFKSRKESSY